MELAVPEGGRAEEDRGEGGQEVAVGGLVVPQPSREASRMPVSAAQMPEIDEADDLDAIDVDAGEPRRVGVAADRLDLLAERGALDEHPERRRARRP